MHQKFEASILCISRPSVHPKVPPLPPESSGNGVVLKPHIADNPAERIADIF